MLIGISIGLIIWCSCTLWNVLTETSRSRLDYPKVLLTFAVFVLMGGSMGYLVNGF